MSPKIEKIVENMSDEEKAKLAGEVLGEVDPTKTNLEYFFESLKKEGESVFVELCCRAAEIESTDTEQ